MFKMGATIVIASLFMALACFPLRYDAGIRFGLIAATAGLGVLLIDFLRRVWGE